MKGRHRLVPVIVGNVILAISFILLPTAILLVIIGSHVVEREGGAVLVDVSLGTILLFSSLAAVIVPFCYRGFPFGAPDSRSCEFSYSDIPCKILDHSINADVQINCIFTDHTPIPAVRGKFGNTRSPIVMQVYRVLRSKTNEHIADTNAFNLHPALAVLYCFDDHDRRYLAPCVINCVDKVSCHRFRSPAQLFSRLRYAG